MNRRSSWEDGLAQSLVGLAILLLIIAIIVAAWLAVRAANQIARGFAADSRSRWLWVGLLVFVLLILGAAMAASVVLLAAAGAALVALVVTARAVELSHAEIPEPAFARELPPRHAARMVADGGRGLRTMKTAERGPGRRSRQQEVDSVPHIIHVRSDPWLLGDSHWCDAPFVIQLAETMFRNRTASRPLALRYLLRQTLLQIAEDFGDSLTGRLARLLAETDKRQAVIAREVGISETWLSRTYMPRVAALVLDALNHMKEE
jgi:hypothetical protein